MPTVTYHYWDVLIRLAQTSLLTKVICKLADLHAKVDDPRAIIKGEASPKHSCRLG